MMSLKVPPPTRRPIPPAPLEVKKSCDANKSDNSFTVKLSGGDVTAECIRFVVKEIEKSGVPFKEIHFVLSDPLIQ